jgi:hypothetical protein
MSETNPVQGNQPTSRSLLRSTLIAAAVAVLILVTIVMPAEYGVDLTGIGRVLGLTEMGKIKRALAAEAAAQETVVANPGDSARPNVVGAPAAASSADTSSDRVTTIALEPGQAREIKLVMRKGARAQYSWSTDRGVVSHTTHGDTVNAPPGKFHEYSKGTGVRADSGVIVAVFTGNHGWYWRNRTREVVTVTLRTRGEYDDLKEIK